MYSSEAQLIDSPYQFPKRPGTPEWRQLATVEEQYRACDIEGSVVARMTTRALVTTCLNYPLRGLILASSSSPKDGLEQLAQQFSGLRELFARTDAAPFLAAEYEARAASESKNPSAPNYIEDAYLTALLLREGLIKQMSAEEKKALLKSSLRLFKSAHDRAGFSEELGIYGRLAMVLILFHEEPIPSSDVNRSAFTTKEGFDFARNDIALIQKEAFLTNLLKLAASQK